VYMYIGYCTDVAYLQTIKSTELGNYTVIFSWKLKYQIDVCIYGTCATWVYLWNTDKCIKNISVDIIKVKEKQ
jgi:hypothetical protein